MGWGNVTKTLTQSNNNKIGSSIIMFAFNSKPEGVLNGLTGGIHFGDSSKNQIIQLFLKNRSNPQIVNRTILCMFVESTSFQYQIPD